MGVEERTNEQNKTKDSLAFALALALTTVQHDNAQHCRLWRRSLRSRGSCGSSWILKVIEAERLSAGKFNFQEHLLGGCSIDATREPLTTQALEAAKAADAVLLGAIGGPKWGTGKVRPEQGILALRKQMGTYGNLRPCNFASDSLVDISPLKAEVCRGTNFNIIHELTGGIYFGERKEDDGDGTAWDTEPYSRPEIERITRLAAHLALQEEPPLPVWSLDKGTCWRQVGCGERL